MINVKEYAWLSAIVYGRDPKNQLEVKTLGKEWYPEPLIYISDDGGTSNVDGGFSAGV